MLLQASTTLLLNFLLLPSLPFISGFANAAPSTSYGHEVADSPFVTGRYIFEFKGSEDGNDSKTIFDLLTSKLPSSDVTMPRHFKHKLFRGATFEIRKTARNGKHGLLSSSIEADDGNLISDIIKSVIDTGLVSNVYPVRFIQRPKVNAEAVVASADVPMLLPHNMTQVDRVHSELKNTGEGIKVGVIDTGIDYMHPALGGGFGPGYKVRYGKDLVGDDFTGAPGELPKPDDDPMDSCDASTGSEGHGTHVSGIIGAKTDTFTSVAPDAILGMWRVFSCKGGSSDDIVIEAMLDAYDQGMDVINLSLGTIDGWPETATSVVAARIIEYGVPVIISGGNEGESGAFTMGSPSVGKGTFTVASIDNNITLMRFFTIAETSDKFEYSPSDPSSGDIPDGKIVPGDTNIGSDADACKTDTIPSDVNGKLALIQRGGCDFDNKANNLAAAGAVGVVVYNSKGGDTMVPTTSTAKIPVVGVSAKAGRTILNVVRSGEASLSFNNKQVIHSVPTGSTVSLFSSIGASYELDLKPNIAGVGGFIYSTIPRQLGSWGLLSGTSMASPYVAGAVALYLKSLEGSPKPTPAFILEHFQNYAYKVAHESSKDSIETPYRQGAGLIQVYDTLEQKVHIAPGDISFNDTANMQKTHTLTITNAGVTAVSYELTNNVSISMVPYNLDASPYFTEPATYGEAPATLEFSKRVIKIAPGASADISVTVTPPSTDPAQHIMYGGFIQLKDLTRKKDLSVPYIGIVGNQRDLPVFGDSTPFVSNVTQAPFQVYKEDDIYVFKKDGAAPQIILSLISPTREIRAPLYNESGKKIGFAFTDLLYYPRSTESVHYMNLQWDGSYKPTLLGLDLPITTQAPAGKYKIGIEALKWLGNPDSEDDWEKWMSCTIQII